MLISKSVTRNFSRYFRNINTPIPERGVLKLWINELNYHFAKWDEAEITISAKNTNTSGLRSLSTPNRRAGTRWYGELIKMMFPLQGAFRFNSLFAVFAVAHPILHNGNIYAHKHNFSEAFTFAYGFFHISMVLH